MLAAMHMLPLLATSEMAAQAARAPQPSLRLLKGIPVDPNLFGFNAEAYIGIVLNKTLNDTAGLAVASDLHLDLSRAPYVVYGVEYIDRRIPCAPFRRGRCTPVCFGTRAAPFRTPGTR